MTESLPAAYFDALYARNPDPWNFAASEYEAEKYAATVAALPVGRYRAGLEVGCSIGILTRRLAARCDRLVSIDIAAEALAQAVENCRDLDTVAFHRMQVPRDWPEGLFDLTVMSEVLYYLSPEDILATAAHAMRTRATGGIMVLVHWLGATDYPCTADAAASLFIDASGLRQMHAARTACYRLDVLG